MPHGFPSSLFSSLRGCRDKLPCLCSRALSPALAHGQRAWLPLASASHASAATDGCSVGLCPLSWFLRDRSPASEEGLCRPLVQDKAPWQAALANTEALQGGQHPRWPECWYVEGRHRLCSRINQLLHRSRSSLLASVGLSA